MEWRFKSAVLGTYEIDQALNSEYYRRYVSNYSNIKWVDTSICYNNDLYLRNILKLNKKSRIISKIPPQMIGEYEFMMSNHLRCLGRDKIDIMLIHNSRSDWKELAKKLESDDRVVESGVSNFTIEQIKEYKDLMGYYPRYNEMEINVNYYDKELIEFCHNNDIKIIAYAILGGKYNARRNISKFTLPYLLTFVGRLAEFVIVRSDNSHRIHDMISYLSLFKEIINEDEYKEELFEISEEKNKSITPDTYSKPKIFTRYAFPTNSDKIHYQSGLVMSTGFRMKESNIQDDLGFNILSSSIPKYEFISDYRVYFRYKLDERLHDLTGKWPIGYYSYPSTYIAKVYKSFLGINTKTEKSALCAVNLLDESDGRLSKIYTGKEKFIIESILE